MCTSLVDMKATDNWNIHQHFPLNEKDNKARVSECPLTRVIISILYQTERHLTYKVIIEFMPDEFYASEFKALNYI